MPVLPIKDPSSYVTQHAIAYADPTGHAQCISLANPLPVGIIPLATPALTGTANASTTVGPFAPLVGRSVMLTLSGDWSGSVQILRSTDGGITQVPVTMGGAVWALYSGNCCEPVWDESETIAQLSLAIVITQGTLAYRLAQ
jgi:hypothetical protein